MTVETLVDFVDCNVWYGPKFTPGPIEVDNHKGAEWVSLGIARQISEDPIYFPPVPPQGGIAIQAAQNVREVMSRQVLTPEDVAEAAPPAGGVRMRKGKK